MSNKTGQLLGTPVSEASMKSQFNPTFFEIYDRSVDNQTCNRLIVVEPFKWHIWAINGQVYLLNESNKSCPINYTPAVLVPSTKSDDLSNQVFQDVCLNKVFNEVVRSYTDNIKPVIVNFKIEDLQARETKFTILDALNFLFTKYITMKELEHVDETDPIVKNNMIHKKHLRSLNKKDLIHRYTYPTIPYYKKQKLIKVIQKHHMLKSKIT